MIAHTRTVPRVAHQVAKKNLKKKSKAVNSSPVNRSNRTRPTVRVSRVLTSLRFDAPMTTQRAARPVAVRVSRASGTRRFRGSHDSRGVIHGNETNARCFTRYHARYHALPRRDGTNTVNVTVRSSAACSCSVHRVATGRRAGNRSSAGHLRRLRTGSTSRRRAPKCGRRIRTLPGTCCRAGTPRNPSSTSTMDADAFAFLSVG